MFTLDSNILISYFNDNEKVVSQLSIWRKNSSRFFISVITEIEILSHPKLTEKEIAKIKRFLGELTIIPVDSQIAIIASEIRRNRKLSVGDSIIVATAVLTNSSLVTQDKEIFKKAKGFASVKTI